MSYYRIIDGRKMDGRMIEQASLSVEGAGDGRISLKDAEAILKFVTDANIFTEVETETIDYIFKNYRWTASAAEWFSNELNTWRSHKVPVSMTVAELSGMHFSKVDVLSNPDDRAARKHALEGATAETNQDHDEIGIWIRLRDGTTVRVFSNFIELEGEFVELRGGCIVPVKAVEKVEI